MAGQGGPRTSRGRRPPTARLAVAARFWRGVLAIFMTVISGVVVADEMRVRIAWGGGADRVWHGTISVRDGSLSDPCPLGIEADEPGSMWLDGSTDRRKLIVRQRSPRNYDGVDVTVVASENSALMVQFSADEDHGSTVTIEVSLAELTDEFIKKDLDNRGNQMMFMRAPGDALRITPARDNLVFSPGEIFKGTLEPHGLPVDGRSRTKIAIQLLDGSGKELWSEQRDAQADRREKIPLEIVLPNAEGVYDVVVKAANHPNWSAAVRQPLPWNRTIAQRRVQLIVLSPQRPAMPRTNGESSQIVEIDPSNPRWFEKLNRLPQLQLTKSRLPRLWKGPLGNQCLQTRQHPLGELAQLKPNAESPDVSWEAYWLPIAQPGRPHVLEVEYPSDVSQTLGVALLEPDASGALSPIVFDAGLDYQTNSVGIAEPPCWRRHRLVFWPQTVSPLLLMTNGRDREPAMYGKIRVFAGGERFESPLPERAAVNRRLLAAYLDRPLFPECFAAGKSRDPWSGRSLDDWRTFHEGGSRLVEYLRYAGYNGLMLAVLADGSALYPSTLLESTPRYDTGIFFATGQDPVRKDVLEMLLRLFDREDLQLIPTLEFAAPLPELEAICRNGGAEAHGIEWIGADGRRWRDSMQSERGLAPYYNVLHPRVQQAMLGVMRELVERYAQHPSFSGVGLRLSADGYAQLPGPEWGLDDATIAQFERDANIRVPGDGPQRFAQRSAFLAREPQRRAWIEWRAAQLGKFYKRLANEIEAIRPGSRLYLAGAELFGGAVADSGLRPSLPRRSTFAEALLRVGIDIRNYQDPSQNVLFLRPERIALQTNLYARAADIETFQMPDFDKCFQAAAVTGSMFFHPMREVRVESFDRKSPFQPSSLWLISQPSPAAEQNRRRFIHSLAALDSQMIIDGGWAIPRGQEDAVREVTAAYRMLPAVRFQTIGNGSANDASQPVAFRSAFYNGRTYLYVLNDAPFGVTARIRIAATPACRIEELTGLRKINPLQADGGSGKLWEVRLEPYDLVAVRLSDSNVQFSNPQAIWPNAVETLLSSHIRKLGARAAALRNPPALDLLANPGFEQTSGDNAPVPDWAVTQRNGVAIELDDSQPHGGRQSARMRSDGGIACLVSHPFAPPKTGRFSMAVWLRVADDRRQPPLRLAVEGKLRGQDYYRFAQVGLPPGPDQPSVPLKSQWGQYVFQVDDLPLEGLSSLRVRFDLMDAGEVWIDDVRIFGLAFSKTELVELSKLIMLANVKLQNGQISDCLAMLDGYWPRFLEDNVALPAGADYMDTAAAQPQKPGEAPPARSGLLNRVKDLVPESLRF